MSGVEGIKILWQQCLEGVGRLPNTLKPLQQPYVIRKHNPAKEM